MVSITKDRIKYTAAVIIATLPLGIWGHTVHQGHLNTLVLSTLILCAFTLSNPFLIGLGSLMAGWLAFAYSSAFVTPMFFPAGAIVNGSLAILIGFIFYDKLYEKVPDAWIINGLCSFVVIQTILGLLQILHLDIVYPVVSSVVNVKAELDNFTPVGTLGNNNFLAACIAIVSPFFFRRWWCLFIPVLVGVLICTKTLSAFAAFVAATGFYFYGWNGVYLAIVPAMVFIFFKYNSLVTFLTDVRFEYWKDAVDKLISASKWHTFFGFGQGVDWKYGDNLHSEYFNTAFKFGLLGFSCLIGYIITVFKYYTADKRVFAAFLALVINMIGNHELHTTPGAVIGMCILVLLERRNEEIWHRKMSYLDKEDLQKAKRQFLEEVKNLKLKWKENLLYLVGCIMKLKVKISRLGK